MKKFIFSACILAMSAGIAKAQTSLHPWGVSLNANFKDYNGEYGRTFFQFRYPNIQYGAGITRYINQWADANFNLNYGKFYHDPTPYWPDNTTPTLNYKGMNLALTGRFKFNNGKWLKEDAFLAPYVSLGFGFFTGKLQQPNRGAEWEKVNLFHIPMGFGLNVRVSPRINLNLNSAWGMSFNDKFDGNESGKHNDQIWEHRFGVTYNFGKGKEASADSEPKETK